MDELWIKINFDKIAAQNAASCGLNFLHDQLYSAQLECKEVSHRVLAATLDSKKQNSKSIIFIGH